MTLGNLTIGIAGGIGAGKSIVSRVLRCNGFPVYDCDFEAKLIMVKDREVKGILQQELGDDIYYPDGNLNRAKLSSILFSDINVRIFVNSIVHNAVKRDIEHKRKDIQGLFFIESALLASSGLDESCNRIWLVEVPIEERIKRIGIRDSLCENEIMKRIESQRDEQILLKMKKTIILENDNRSPLLPFILRLTDKLNNNQIFTILC